MRTSAAVTLLIVLACHGCGGPKMTVEQQLNSPAGVERVQGIMTVGEKNLTAEIPRLIDFLEDPDVSVRVTSVRTLRKMTGKNFGFVAYTDEPQRREAVAKWRAWYQKSGGAS